jgi:hypothetical protein
MSRHIRTKVQITHLDRALIQVRDVILKECDTFTKRIIMPVPKIPFELQKNLEGLKIRISNNFSEDDIIHMCEGVNPDYVIKALENSSYEKWFFSDRKGRAYGFIIFQTNGCAGISGEHVVISLICAHKDPKFRRLGTLMMITFMLLMQEKKIKTIFLEAAAKQTVRKASEQEQKLICWYEGLGFSLHDSTCHEDNEFKIYKKRLGLNRTALLDLLNPSECNFTRKSCEKFCPKRTTKKRDIHDYTTKNILLQAARRAKIKNAEKYDKSKLIELLDAQLPNGLIVTELREILARFGIPNARSMTRQKLLEIW